MKAADGPHSLTGRQSEMLEMLARGLSGAEIARELVLSPETVRTHLRNAMTRLGATTRAHAVALALQSHEIHAAGLAEVAEEAEGERAELDRRPLVGLLAELASLCDVDGGVIYLLEEDGLTMRLAAAAGGPVPGGSRQTLALGDGALGRAALERRAHVSPIDAGSAGTLLTAPLIGERQCVGVIAVFARPSRPINRGELLLIQLLGRRIGDVLVQGSQVERGLELGLERFRVAWRATSPPVP